MFTSQRQSRQAFIEGTPDVSFQNDNLMDQVYKVGSAEAVTASIAKACQNFTLLLASMGVSLSWSAMAKLRRFCQANPSLDIRSDICWFLILGHLANINVIQITTGEFDRKYVQ